MDNQEIIDFLEEKGVSEVEELRSEKDNLIIRFYYDFDKDELAAARAYANEESDVEEESAEWYKEWYLPYLYDIAKDELDETFEELNEEFNTSSLLKNISDDASNTEYIKFVSIICNEEYEKDLEEELNDYV